VVRVKICGLTNYEDAEFALESGADALGFVYEPSSPRYIGDDQDLAMMPFRFSPYAVTVGVYGKMGESVDPCLIEQYVEKVEVRSFRERLAGIAFRDLRPAVRSFRMGPEESAESLLKRITEVHDSTPNMHAALIDAFDKDQFGGTGKRVDWDLVAEVRSRTDIPLILAGGLTPENVAEAIRKVRPYAIDVSSGVELNPRKKEPSKVRDFILASKQA
jgi:phosphoribosylanthranilate isomerase